MRLINSARNIKAAWMLQAIHILCQFITRTAIIKVLSIEYVGLSGLFGNILTMLSLADLGIAEAITFSLYEPISKKDSVLISAIMKFYKKVYICVGLFILIAGALITPYISVFIKDLPDNIPDLKLIYLLFVINSAISYFFSYKATYITANQKDYIVSLNNGLNEAIMVIIQVVVLVCTCDYILFLIVGVGFVIIRNVTITYIANKKYPYLCEKTREKIPKDIFKKIMQNTGAMIFHKIGSMVVFATDNLILSMYVGLTSVGLYTNYCVITNAVKTFINKLFVGITASVGNLAVEEEVEKQEKIFEYTMFLNFWLYTFACCCLFNLLNPFIGIIWLGKEFIFDLNIVLFMVLSLYITGMRTSVQTFKSAKGLYWQNKFMPIAESIINLIASIYFVNKFEVVGVIIGTIISSLLTCVWVEPRVLYKYGFNKSTKNYYLKYLKYFILFCMVMLITFISVCFIKGDDVIVFILKLVVCAVVPNIALICVFRKKDEYIFFKKILFNILKIKQ